MSCLEPSHRRVSGLRSSVAQDIQRYLNRSPEDTARGNSPKTRLGAFLTGPVLSLFLYRVAHLLHVRGWPRSAELVTGANLLIHKARITPQSCLGPGCLLPHPAGVTFHGRAGRELTFYAMSVCLPNGTCLETPVERAPLLGDRVIVGAQVTLQGAISIGDGARIAPKLHVKRDLAPECLAVSKAMRPRLVPQVAQRSSAWAAESTDRIWSRSC